MILDPNVLNWLKMPRKSFDAVKVSESLERPEYFIV
jgi:hypothetical protein